MKPYRRVGKTSHRAARNSRTLLLSGPLNSPDRNWLFTSNTCLAVQVRVAPTSSPDVIISDHMLKMAWQPLGQPWRIRAKQSSDFPHNCVYSPQNHADTSCVREGEPYMRAAFEEWRRPAKASPQMTPTSAGELCVSKKCRRHRTSGKEDYTWKKYKSENQTQQCAIFGPPFPTLPRTKKKN